MKTIVVGIDVSKEKLDVTAIDVRNPQQGVVKLDYQVFDNRPMGFRRMLVWARRLIKGTTLDDVMFCCETTGGYDRLLCDYIYAKGVAIWRESALQIKRSVGVRKGKNDKADSLMIAEYAMRNMDKAVFYESPNENIRNLKALFLYRNRLVQKITHEKVRTNHLVATMPSGSAKSFIKRDAQKHIKALMKSLKECETEILRIINEDESLSRNYKHITSIKGISLVNAVAIIAYSNNFKTITNARKMASYYGVANFRETSGTSINRQANTKYYSCSLLRAILSQAAECTIMKKGIYHAYYDRLKKKGKPTGVILNNIKNKLIHLIYSLVKNNMDFEPDYEYNRIARNCCQNDLSKTA